MNVDRQTTEPTATELLSTAVRRTYCAECANCVVYRQFNSRKQYIQRVKCKAGHWHDRTGHEATTYEYRTVLRRTVVACPGYSPTCDTEAEQTAFLKSLRAKLLLRRVIHEVKS